MRDSGDVARSICVRKSGTLAFLDSLVDTPIEDDANDEADDNQFDSISSSTRWSMQFKKVNSTYGLITLNFVVDTNLIVLGISKREYEEKHKEELHVEERMLPVERWKRQ